MCGWTDFDDLKYKYYSREEWGATPAADRRPIATPVQYVVIHHTYLPAACNTTQQCFSAMKSMQDYHNSMGWGDIGYQRCTERALYLIYSFSNLPAACNTTQECFSAMKSMQDYHNSMEWGDIGYHFCVGSNGGVYEGRGWNVVGIHAGRANNHSYGICLIGDWRVATPPKTMLESTKRLISIGVENGSISPNYKLIGHNQVMATECPGTALFNIISTWNHFSTDVAVFKTVAKNNALS
ncbi:Peptidoglycan-recognition protein LB [Papilio machaon]|uniref:Peptidoglycan recognition protein n=1 Tax=Papilio machaon TaxID=76193 RepID=A0A194R1F7_PAPMA|nr:Peptidoglycan-recognition protein LB [Papilio machaon]